MSTDNVIRPRQWQADGEVEPVVHGSAVPAWTPDPAESDPADPATGNPEPAPAAVEPGPGSPGYQVRDPADWPPNPPRFWDPSPGAPARVRNPDPVELNPAGSRVPGFPGSDPAGVRGPVFEAGPVLRALGTGVLWAVTGAGVVVPVAVGRWAWQPDEGAKLAAQRKTLRVLAEQVRTSAESGELVARPHDERFDAAVKRGRRELRKSRAVRVGVLAAAGPAAWWGVPALVEVTPWYVDVGGVVGGLAGLVLAGRWWMSLHTAAAEFTAADEAPAMPRGLALADSDRGARAELQAALNDAGARARVEAVSRGVTGWGYRFVVRLAAALTPRQLDDLAHALNVRRGGLVVETVSESTQLYVVRTILADLLGEGVRPIPSPPGFTIEDRAPMVRRYDGAVLGVPLVRSALLFGATGSGKSAALREYLRWIVTGGAHVVGIDLAGGADLDAYREAMHAHVFENDVAAADRLLRFMSALVRDRTARLRASGSNEWTPDMGRPWVVVIDEYWDTAQHKGLRALVEHIAVSGRKVRVRVILANNKRTKELMRSTVLQSQIDVVWLFSMSPDDEAGLPSAWRAGGARPSTLQAALDDDPRDAGKAYGVGVGRGVELARFPYSDKDTGREVAAAHPAPDLDEHDLQVWAQFTRPDTREPVIMGMIRDAIVAAAATRPGETPRASVAEIAQYVNRQHPPAEWRHDEVTRHLTEMFGREHRPRQTFCNFAPGNNPRGYRLDHYDEALAVWREARHGRDGTPANP